MASNSAAAKKLGLDMDQPLPGPQVQEKPKDTWRDRRRRSEWVFRPLRVKFKVKELEALYKNSVYRQKQSLLLSACVLMSLLSFLLILTYLGAKKVSLIRNPWRPHPIVSCSIFLCGAGGLLSSHIVLLFFLRLST